jgi:ketosteroid isomerase-like protein
MKRLSVVLPFLLTAACGVTPAPGGAPISVNGKYLWLYRRQPDGSWKQSRVMWNSSDPLPKGGV